MTFRPPDDIQSRVELSDGVIVVQWRAAEPTELDAGKVVQRVVDLAAGMEYPLLFEIQGVRSVNYGVRKTFASASWPVTSVAIVAASSVDWTAANFYLARHPPACTARLFTSVPEAMKWLDGDFRQGQAFWRLHRKCTPRACRLPSPRAQPRR